MKILVAEDNEDSRNLLVKVVRGYGHEVMAAADGVEALEQALAQPPDIIVSDILMPKMDGYQLCQECKQNEKLKNIPVVFYSATYTLEEDKKFALSVGAAAFILKPTEPDILIQMLSEVFEKAKAGALAPPEVAPLEPSLFLAEHDKRIFAKLERKVSQLEAEITRRKQAQEEVEHLNRVLHTIRGVNQLIVREKEQDRLLKSACATLVENRDYENTCICLFDESGMLVTHAEAGLGKDFLTVIERLKRGELTDCINRTLIQSDVVTTKASSLTCGDCPLVKTCSGTKVVTVRIEHGGKVYGLLKLQLSGDASISGEEQSLLQEVTGDIGFALHDMELEEERKQAEELFRTLASSSPVGIYIIQDRKCRFANLWFQKYTGYSEDELLGMESFAFVDPEDRERVRQNEVEMLRGTRLSPYEFRYIGKSGETKWAVETVVSIQYQGKRATLGNFMDITERKRAEEELRRAAEEWETTFGSVMDSVSIHDKDFRLMRANKAFADAVNMKPEELVGRHCYEIVHGTNEPVPDCPHRKTLETKKPAMGEYFEPHLGIHLEVVTAPILNDKGEIVASAHVARDVSERKRAEEDLSRLYEEVKALNLELEERVKERTRQFEEAIQVAEVANRAKSDFLASMSHELRTPLNAVIGFSQVLQEQYFGKLNEKQAEYVTDILESGQHLLALINDILDLSKIEAGKMELGLSKVIIKDLLESSLVMIKEKALVHGISLDIDTAGDLEGLEITADERRIKQVMFNLLSNASKFTPDGGAITVKGRKEGKELIISVSDTGIGIAHEDQERIFEEFYQTNRGSLKDKIPGTGLGLPVTRSIVEMHGGRIWVESEGPDKGSRFTFTLPI